MNTILYILFLSLIIFFIARLTPKIKLSGFGTAILVAVVFSLVDFFLGHILRFIGFPFIIVTFGLFLLVINTFLLWITDKLIPGFEIRGLKTTFITAFLISLASYVLEKFL